MPMPVRTLSAVVMVAVSLLASSSRLQALGPTVMMFYGGTLTKPVFVTGADIAAFGDLLRPATVAVKDLGNRPYLGVAFFWGPETNPALNGHPISELTPQMAWQHGRFYAAAGSQPAVLLATQLTKSTQAVPVPTAGAAFVNGGPIQDSAIAVLKRLGIPVTTQGISH